MTKQWPPIAKRKKDAKVGPELFQCVKCKTIVYSGSRSISVIQIDYPKAIEGKICIDHIEPVMDLNDVSDERDWNKIISRMFCGEDNLQALCSSCHELKTTEEKKLRAQIKRERGPKKETFVEKLKKKLKEESSI